MRPILFNTILSVNLLYAKPFAFQNEVTLQIVIKVLILLFRGTGPQTGYSNRQYKTHNWLENTYLGHSFLRD